MMKRILLILLLPVLAYSQNFKPMMGVPIDIAHPLSDFVGTWFLLEGSGNKVFDLSGNGNELAFVGTAPFWTSGKFGSAVNLPGTDEYLQAPASASLNYAVHNNDLTVWVWWKTDDTANSDQGIFDIAVGAQDRMYCEWETGPNIRLFLETSDTGRLNNTYATSINDTHWHNIALVMQGTTWSLYVDGILEASPAPSAALTTMVGSPYFSIGKGYFGSNIMDGQVDNAGMIARALSASEIALLCREPFCMFEEDDVALKYIEAPAAPGGQVITIQFSSLFLIITLVCIVKGRKLGK